MLAEALANRVIPVKPTSGRRLTSLAGVRSAKRVSYVTIQSKAGCSPLPGRGYNCHLGD